MNCPKCKSTDIKVIEKRDIAAEGSIRRRRECLNCGERFTTYERIEVPALLVVKKSGGTELYLKEKMSAGLYKALEKRPFSPAQIERFAEEIDHNVNTCGLSEVPTSKIGDLISEKLKNVDEVAYLRFVSVYKSFENVEAFQKELNQVICGADECGDEPNKKYKSSWGKIR